MPRERKHKLRQLTCLAPDCSCDDAAASSAKMITSQGVHGMLSVHVLPLLDLCDLGAFACTCRELRDLTYEREDLWRSAAEVRFLRCPNARWDSLMRASLDESLLACLGS